MLSALHEIREAHEMIIAKAKNIFFINKFVENLTIAYLQKKIFQLNWQANFGSKPFFGKSANQTEGVIILPKKIISHLLEVAVFESVLYICSRCIQDPVNLILMQSKGGFCQELSMDSDDSEKSD